MLVTIGKHKGKTVGTLVLKHPDHIKWVLEQRAASGGLAQIQREAERLIEIFDAKPILGACSGRNCLRQPVRFTAHAGRASALYPWCDSCDPYTAGAPPGTLAEIRTYRDALRHIEWTYEGLSSGYKAIIKAIARSKGLPKRVGEQEIDAFFA